MKIIILLLVGLTSWSVFALEPLADSDLQSIDGQAGADLSLKLSLNHNIMTDSALQAGTVPTFNCGTSAAELSYCRLAISLNNRFVNWNTANSQWIENSESGNKLWLVAKGIQGTVNLQLLGLDGVKLDTVYGSTGAYSIDPNKPAIQLGAKASLPIQIRNLGFNALSIERDNFITNSSGVEVGSTNPSDYGYLKEGLYNESNAPGSVFDHGRETGFMGIMMNGNLALQGKVLMFSCDSSHPRCS